MYMFASGCSQAQYRCCQNHVAWPIGNHKQTQKALLQCANSTACARWGAGRPQSWQSMKTSRTPLCSRCNKSQELFCTCSSSACMHPNILIAVLRHLLNLDICMLQSQNGLWYICITLEQTNTRQLQAQGNLQACCLHSYMCSAGYGNRIAANLGLRAFRQLQTCTHVSSEPGKQCDGHKSHIDEISVMHILGEQTGEIMCHDRIVLCDIVSIAYMLA